MPVSKLKKKTPDLLKSLKKRYQILLKEPEKFLKPQPEKYDDIRKLLQTMYRVTVASDVDNASATEVLPELVVEDMDEEQIWQQLELRNNHVIPQLVAQTNKLAALGDENFELILKGVNDESSDDEISEHGEFTDEEDAAFEDTASNGLNTDDDENDEDKNHINDSEDDDYLAELSEKNNSRSFKKKGRKTVVDDKFFKLSEMEEFLEQEDAKEMLKQKGKVPKSIIDDIDLFAEDFDEDKDSEDSDNVNYKDFFDSNNDNSESEEPQKGKKNATKRTDTTSDAGDDQDDGGVYDDDDADDDDDDNDDDDDGNELKNKGSSRDDMQPASDTESDANADDTDSQQDEDEDEKVEETPQSTFELREARLKARMREYEEIVLGEKPWQLKGEVQGTHRPQNSLLEELLEFESTVRPPPVITEETTRTLEDIIKQRIRDQAWDDVVPKAPSAPTPQDYRKQLVLDQEKSKASLAQIYEKDYQRELDKIDPKSGEGGNEPEPKEHQEIRNAMQNLFIKLDALSNFHFTPKPVAPEAKIITNTPAIFMEEVAPVTVSDAKLLAPEEVFRGPKHDLLGKSERTKTDKNRERRKKKQKQRAIHNALEKRDKNQIRDGKPLSRKREGAKLLKTITKARNVETIKASNDQSALKSSKSFFNQLQDTTRTGGGGKKRQAPKDTNTIKVNAKKLKL